LEQDLARQLPGITLFRFDEKILNVRFIHLRRELNGTIEVPLEARTAALAEPGM
jgi:hypothetical protein